MIIQQSNVTYSPKLPLVFPILGLNDASSIATWGLQSVSDSSGNGHDLVTSATFNAQGMVCTTTTPASTGASETDEMTILFTVYIPTAPAATGNLISNLVNAAAPFAGFRITIAQNQTGTVSVSSGAASPAVYTLTLPSMVGAWRTVGVTITNSLISAQFSTGSILTSPVSARAKSTEKLVLNGAPIASQLTTGLPGTLGVVALYNRALTSTEITTKINTLRTIMALRGVTI